MSMYVHMDGHTMDQSNGEKDELLIKNAQTAGDPCTKIFMYYTIHKYL